MIDQGVGSTQRNATGRPWGISRAGPAPACLAAALARRSTIEERRRIHAPQAELEQAAQLVQQVAAGAIVAAATRKLNLEGAARHRRLGAIRAAGVQRSGLVQRLTGIGKGWPERSQNRRIQAALA